jgi:uncharacterized protein (DUF952 family)
MRWRHSSASAAREGVEFCYNAQHWTDEARSLMTTIYKICAADEWAEAERDGAFRGSAVDYADGYIHFSTASQVAATAARHFAGKTGLKLVAVEADELGDALKWEASRGGALFPHLYGALPLAAVRWVKPLRLDDDGRHVLPPLED